MAVVVGGMQVCWRVRRRARKREEKKKQTKNEGIFMIEICGYLVCRLVDLSAQSEKVSFFMREWWMDGESTRRTSSFTRGSSLQISLFEYYVDIHPPSHFGLFFPSFNIHNNQQQLGTQRLITLTIFALVRGPKTHCSMQKSKSIGGCLAEVR